MKHPLYVSSGAYRIVKKLQASGYEAYIVGGAIRDLLLDKQPKDFDIACSGTPEEIKKVFGRRNCRIIGKRFRLAHVLDDGELYEVSTFRTNPQQNRKKYNSQSNNDKLPENLIVSDNVYGTAKEDASRRDFSVNALFYDPVQEELYDYTGMGLDDIKNKIVRAIGNPALRFEEDPVRMLRALKLVAQFDFTLDNTTENALFAKLSLLRHAAPSRLSLELEKILHSTAGDRHLEIFHNYGLLQYFLPNMNSFWGSSEQFQMLALLEERNARVDEGRYRDSVSLAAATIAFPFVASRLTNNSDFFWEKNSESKDVISLILKELFAPLSLMNCIFESSIRILQMQPLFEPSKRGKLQDMLSQRSYPHARELFIIRHAVAGENVADLEKIWPRNSEKHRKFNQRENKKYGKF